MFEVVLPSDMFQGFELASVLGNDIQEPIITNASERSKESIRVCTPPFPDATGDDICSNIGRIQILLNALHGTVQRCLLDPTRHFVLILLLCWPAT